MLCESWDTCTFSCVVSSISVSCGCILFIAVFEILTAVNVKIMILWDVLLQSTRNLKIIRGKFQNSCQTIWNHILEGISYQLSDNFQDMNSYKEICFCLRKLMDLPLEDSLFILCAMRDVSTGYIKACVWTHCNQVMKYI